MTLYEKLVAMLPRAVQAIEYTIFDEEPSRQVSNASTTKCIFNIDLNQEYQAFLTQFKNMKIGGWSTVADEYSSSLAKRMGKLGILMLRKIATMATSTENFASKLVDIMNAELTEQRKMYQEAISMRSKLKQELTTAEGNEKYYREKLNQYKSELDAKVKLVTDLAIPTSLCWIFPPACLGLLPALAVEQTNLNNIVSKFQNTKKKYLRVVQNQETFLIFEFSWGGY